MTCLSSSLPDAMRWILWTAGYLTALFLEVAFLPRFFGTAVPSLHLMPLILGIVFQGFWPGLWFSGLAGLSRDVLIPGTAGTEVMAALLVFLAVRLFLALNLLDTPLERIGAIAVGLGTIPAASRLAIALVRGFGAAVPSFHGSALLGGTALRELAFATAWFLVAAWLITRSVERQRREALDRIV